jgi:signal peptide peptidase SppA
MIEQSYVLQAFMEKPWAILPSKLAALTDVVVRHVQGEKLTTEEIQARIHGATRPESRRVNNVAVLPLFGSIFPRANLLTEMSGATSAEDFSRQFQALVDDPQVDAIVLDVDSPGGQVGGIEEASKLVYDARGKKPVVAVANHTVASAAYWIASAASELVVSPSGEVGSIGVFTVHEDVSAAMQTRGVKTSIISRGKNKVIGNPYEPLSDEARGVIQAGVDETYEMFVNAVARNRGVSADDVRRGYGEGGMVGAQKALELGMADRIATLDETIQRLKSGNEINGQAPDETAEPQAQARLAENAARLKTAILFEPGENLMNVREYQKQHAEKVERAQALVELATAEGRDLDVDEQAEFDACLNDAEALSAKIEEKQAQADRLKAQVEKMSVGGTPADKIEKPESNASAKKTLTRAEFDALTSTEKAAFSRTGGKIEN